MRVFIICFVLIMQLTLPGVGQQAISTTQPLETACTFDDGKQIKVQYNNSPAKGVEEFHDGKLWQPGRSPMFLFTQAALTLGSSVISEGAYNLYIIPAKQNWVLVVNRNVSTGSAYDEQQDLARVPMQIAPLESPVKPAQIVFAHLGPK
jgi:hypothetical protein